LTPERWAQIEELFHRAAECEPQRRTSLLDEACSNDPELRKEVAALLSSERSAGKGLQAAVHYGLEAFGFPLAGETISHYRVLDGLGGGGMGLVYRAEDVKLGRQVALKFLPEESAKDPAALKRFEREARSASALEHPNICPIYEFGEHEGQPFLVMQLLEGQTLRELISAADDEKVPLELSAMLDLAIQIADGLDAAHRRGIIHRDIKPANIFVTSQGQAKILDFGLAKLAVVAVARNGVEPQPGDDGEVAEGTPRQALPPATPDPFLTRTGMAMGTAGYMSPEQVRGEKLDARTDLFSFGLVLYEMATRQRAFKGETGPVLQEAILNQTPRPVRELNARIPAKLEAIINKALEENREARYPSASEMRAELESVKRAMEPKPSVRWWGTASAVLLAAALLVAGATFWLIEHRSRFPQAQPELKLQQLTTNSFENHVTSGTISPDGKYLAYSDTKGMYVKLIETGETRVVPQPEEFKNQNVVWQCAPWFPDSAGFVANAHRSGIDAAQWDSHESNIWMVSVLGGAPRKLRDNAMAYSVSPDGSRIGFGTNKGRLGDREIWLMGTNGDQARKLFDTDEESSITGLSWSGDGKRVLYVKTDQSGDTLLNRDLVSGPPSTIFGPTELKQVGDFFWLADGRLVYSVAEPDSLLGSHCSFWEMRLDGRTGEPVEKPRRLTNWSGFCISGMSETADRRKLAFLKVAGKQTSFLADLAVGGTRILRLRHFPLSESSDGVVDWTPDSKAIFFNSNRSGHNGIYRQSLDQDVAESIVPEGYGRDPRVTPDGKSIVYLGIGENGPPPARGPEPVMRVSTAGGVSERLFMARPFSLLTCAKSPSALCVIGEPTEDGQQLIVNAIDLVKGRGPELFRFPLVANDDTWFLDLSPDGTRVAATRTAAGPIYILSSDGHILQPVHVKGWSNLESFTWNANGTALFVTAGIRNGKEVLHVDVQGNAHILWESAGGSGETEARPSPDGRHLAFHGWTTSGNIWTMENF
jgi:eukaryotic-like serine/threonine-protein kinase